MEISSTKTRIKRESTLKAVYRWRLTWRTKSRSQAQIKLETTSKCLRKLLFLTCRGTNIILQKIPPSHIKDAGDFEPFFPP